MQSTSYLILLLALALTHSGSLTVKGFQSPKISQNAKYFPTATGSTQHPVLFMSILDDIKNKSDNNEFDGFNPFDYSKDRSISSVNYSGTLISLRKTTMTEMVNELLNMDTVDNMQPILDSYKDFLLEPLDDDDAVLDPDSIYTSTMTRDDRYDAYRKSMEERVSQAKNPKVKQVLMAMKDFVLSFE